MTEWFTEVSESDTRTSYPITRKVIDCSTPACESVVIADSAVFGRMLFLDGELQSASVDEHIYHESLVHPAMTGFHNARVLVVGGGEGATVREVLRWSPFRVDWIDIDRELVELCEEHLKWAPDVYLHPTVHYQAADIRVALPNLGLYDVIILDLPDPDGDTGYLYSTAFWTDLFAHLVLGGRIVTHVGPVSPVAAPYTYGPGFERVRSLAAVAGLAFSPAGFYRIGIPSFQGDWGFAGAVKGGDPFFGFDHGLIQKRIPWVRVADARQVREWADPPLLWRPQSLSHTG